MDCIVHGVTKSRTRLSDFHFTSPKVCTPSLFFSVLFIQTPISFPFLGGDIFSSPPTGVKRLGHEERAGLSMVSFLVSTLEIGRFLGLFYFFYPHTPVLTTGIIYSVRVSGFEINPQWLRAVLHRLCPSLSTHYDCRATNILMIPGTHAKRKTVDLVKTTWCSGDFPGGPVLRLCNKTSYTVLMPVQRSRLFIITSQNTPMEQLLLLSESLTTVVILLHF